MHVQFWLERIVVSLRNGTSDEWNLMQLKDISYRIFAYLRHFFTSWNTGGEGVHSPYLFYLVKMLMYDKNAYYCFDAIEQCRLEMLQSKQMLVVMDYGTGAIGAADTYQRSVENIARHSLESPQMGQLLFRFAVYLGQEARRPLEIVELGTSFGITTAYLASAHSRNRVVTFEGSDEIAAIAQKNWQRLKLENITLVSGNIDDTIYNYARAKIDIAYIDANHTEEATIRYFRYLLPMAVEKTLFIIDDIHHSPGMQRAWRTICACPEVTTTMDIWGAGIVFFDPHYMRCHYTLRI